MVVFIFFNLDLTFFLFSPTFVNLGVFGDTLLKLTWPEFLYMDVSQNRGKTPKMDGENNGKPY